MPGKLINIKQSSLSNSGSLSQLSEIEYLILQRAVALQGRTITDFVTLVIQDAAQQTIEEVEIINLSLADQKSFAEAIIYPPKPLPALK